MLNESVVCILFQIKEKKRVESIVFVFVFVFLFIFGKTFIVYTHNICIAHCWLSVKNRNGVINFRWILKREKEEEEGGKKHEKKLQWYAKQTINDFAKRLNGNFIGTWSREKF